MKAKRQLPSQHRKKRRIHAEFNYVQSFNSEQEALAFVKSENWAKYYNDFNNPSEAGKRQMLRCRKVKFSVHQKDMYPKDM